MHRCFVAIGAPPDDKRWGWIVCWAALIVVFNTAWVSMAGQTAPRASSGFSITVTDENGVAVPSARIVLTSPTGTSLRCETDFAGRCRIEVTAGGKFSLRAEKVDYYATEEPSVEVDPGGALDVTLHREQEVREIVNVTESVPAIDPTQISAQQSISGLDVINIPYPGTHDYRNVLNFIPGVVQDNFGQPHVAGAQTYETETLLDGFNITQPANGELIARISTDAFRSIEVESAREPAEYGKGPGGVLALNTGIGDDHYRFWATDFLPSFQDKNGWKFDQFLPRFTFSGPIVKGKAWFYDALDGEYENTVYTDLPAAADYDHLFRIGNLTKLQTNITSRNILSASLLLNHLHDDYPYLSPEYPQASNPSDTETAYITSIKDQFYSPGGELLETGFGFDQYELELTPYGNSPFWYQDADSNGSYYLSESTRARRWQGLANLFLPPKQWHGRHDFKFGADADRLSYEDDFGRQPISFLISPYTLTSANECLIAPLDANYPCTRYSTFGPAPFHETFNTELSAYAEDRWAISNRLLIEPGIRVDWDQIVRTPVVAPRLAGTYVLNNAASTKISAGVGIIYESTPLFLIARPFEGTRSDTFYSVAPPPCSLNCVTSTGPVTTQFAVDPYKLQAPRFLSWSLGLEQKLPKAVYLKAEYLQKRGQHGFVYDTASGAPTGEFLLENTRQDHYRAVQISLRHNFHETYMIMGSYTRSRSLSNQVFDFNVDSPILSSQEAGPYPWDVPNRFLFWGYLPFFKLPLLHQTEIAFSGEARDGFAFSEFNDQQQIIGPANAYRFPYYYSLNVQLEKRFHLFKNYWAVRGGFDNLTGRCNPYAVNGTIDATHPVPTFGACAGRAFTSRIRLIGRK